MTTQDYVQKKRECWEQFCRHIVDEEEEFYNMFDRACELGREKETISQEDIEKAALDYIRTNPFVNSRTATTARESFVDGANFALGKQEKEEETIPHTKNDDHFADADKMLRLQIATQILSSIVGSPKPVRHPIKHALELADALMAESQKGGVK